MTAMIDRTGDLYYEHDEELDMAALWLIVRPDLECRSHIDGRQIVCWDALCTYANGEMLHGPIFEDDIVRDLESGYMTRVP